MLSDRDILKRLCATDQSRIIITPLLWPKQIQPSSVDVRLGFHFKTVRTGGVAVLDPVHSLQDQFELEARRYTHDIKLSAGRAFYIHPGEFALGTTFEFVRLPADVAASLEGRSSLARLGITVHSTAGFIDPGFSGRITYEIQNEGTQPVALYPGMRVAQLCFFKLSKKSVLAYGESMGSKYKQQLSTTASLWYRDADVRFFRFRFGGAPQTSDDDPQK